MHPCTPPSNGHAFNMYWWYCIVHVQQTLNYTNLTTAPKCKKPNLNLCMCAGVGVWVLLKSPFCVKHPIFTNISWDFDNLSTKTWHAHMLHTMFEVQSIHLQAALWMEMSLSQIKKIPSFWEWPPPSPRNNWGPRCTFFPFFIVFVKDSILGNWLQKRAPEARVKSSAKRERRRRESLQEAQEIPRSGETNSQFLALNSCKAHTSSISCSYLVCDIVCATDHVFVLYQWKLFGATVSLGTKVPSANLTRAKALVPRAFGARLALRARCLVHKQYKTESLAKTICDTDYLLLFVGKFFFHPTRISFFFSSHVGQVFFFPFYVWVKFFFFLPLNGSIFFFFTKTSCSPPWCLMVHP